MISRVRIRKDSMFSHSPCVSHCPKMLLALRLVQVSHPSFPTQFNKRDRYCSQSQIKWYLHNSTSTMLWIQCHNAVPVQVNIFLMGKKWQCYEKNKWSRVLLSITNSRQATNPLASIAKEPVMNDPSVMPSIHRLAALCPFLCAFSLQGTWMQMARGKKNARLRHDLPHMLFARNY